MVPLYLTIAMDSLPMITEKMPYKEEANNESYDEVETNIKSYLPDDQPIPMEMDSSNAEHFEDHPGITSHLPDVKGIQAALQKLSNSFQQATTTYTELAMHLPTLPVEDVALLVKALPEPETTNHGPLAKAIKEH